MSDQDALEGILASLYDAMLDDSRWPAASALIDDACGLKGNGLMVAEGPENDIRATCVGAYYRGQRRQDLQTGTRTRLAPGPAPRRDLGPRRRRTARR